MCRQQDALQDPEQQHRDQRDRRGIEIDPADPPHAHQRGDIDQLVDRGEDDRRQHRLGKIGQQAREKQQAERKRDRADDQRQRRFGAGLVVDSGLRQAAGDGIAVAERDREVGRAQSQKLLPDIEAVAMLGGKASRRGDAFDIGKQQDAGCERKQLVELQQPEGRQSQSSAAPSGWLR